MNFTTYRKRNCRSLSRAIAAGLASAILTASYCGMTLAEEKQPDKALPVTDALEKWLMGMQDKQILEQLSHRIESLDHDLKLLRERLGPNDPNVVRAEKERAELVALQTKVKAHLQGELNDDQRSDLIKQLSAFMRPQTTAPQPNREQLAQRQLAIEAEVKKLHSAIAEREAKIAALAEQVRQQQRRPALPPLENGQLKIFSLKNSTARDAAQTIESLFGSESLRLAVDERGNKVIAYGKTDAMAALEALLTRVDEQTANSAPSEKSKPNSAAAIRTLVLRVFWLADGLPKTEGQSPSDFLPKSVLLATQKLGLEAPRLVTQTGNSLAIGRDEGSGFGTTVPAVLLKQPASLSCAGQLKFISDDRVRLDMTAQVGGPAVNCDLRGSLTTPLGHYMVLGTANSMIAEGQPSGDANAAGGRAPGMGPGMGAEMGPGGAFRGGEFGRRGPGVPGAMEGGPEGVGYGGVASNAAGGLQAAKVNFNTSRFAFVVQVVEGESYAADKTATPDAKRTKSGDDPFRE
jgi:type II/III secretion system protein